MHRCMPGACTVSPDQHLAVSVSGSHTRSQVVHFDAQHEHAEIHLNVCCLTHRCDGMWRG